MIAQTSPIVTIILALVGVSAAVLGVLRGRKADVAADKQVSVSQVTAELNKILDRYEADNVSMRTRIEVLDKRLAECENERGNLKNQLAELEAKYGVK